MKHLRLATRGSQLAVAQSQQVADAVSALAGVPVDLVVISTRGDRVQDRPLAQVGGKGLFTKELEDALLSGEVDFAVHSMKDMPTDQPDGLGFAAIPARVDPRDVLVGATLDDLKPGSVVGTGSLRRARQILQLRPDLRVEGIRGNVDTRIQKQRDGKYDAILLAAAGMHRLGRIAEASQFLEPEQMLPAVGQGALALQVRLDRLEVVASLAPIGCAETAAAVEAERAFLTAISGGCSVPAACYAVVQGDELWVRGLFAKDGGEVQTAEARGDLTQAAALGERVARAVI